MVKPAKYLLQEKVDQAINSAIKEKVFNCAAVGLSFFENSLKETLIFAYGKDKGIKIEKGLFFDLASLTKPLATTLAVLCLIKEKKFALQSPLGSLLDSHISEDKKKITIEQLLNHSSGLAAYNPFFQELEGSFSQRKETLISRILNEPLQEQPGSKQVYSDLGFILLGKIVEVQSGAPLNIFVEDKVLKPIGLETRLFFLPGNKPDKTKNYAPTEQCSWRNKLICGQVHDDNTYAVGGVSGQAGLFGNIDGVLILVDYLFDVTQGRKEHPNFKSTDLQKAVIKKSDIGSWGLGFDTPSVSGSSSGKYFSNKSFGHLGFTGTSFWVDMEKKISIVLLTNRVNPDRDNIKIRTFRPLFHDAIMKILTN